MVIKPHLSPTCPGGGGGGSGFTLAGALFLDPEEKDLGETTSYSGRIDTQSRQNNSGRTRHRAK